VRTKEIEVRASQTKPPARFTEATLLSAMEGAGKLVEDEELREAMSEKGLGTPATRAQVIEGLIFEDYVHRIGRDLHPTPKASSLLFALRHFGVNELCSPELTGNWEFQLKQMEHGALPRSTFMDHIVDLTREMVSRIKRGDIPDTAFLTLKIPCPKCGSQVNETYRKFKCQKCDFSIWKVVSSREFAPEEIETLIEKKSVGPLTDSAGMGKPFAAVGAWLTPDCGVRLRRASEGKAPKGDFTGLTPRPCPKCGSRVFGSPWPTWRASVNVIALTSVQGASSSRGRSGARRCQKPSPPEEPTSCTASFVRPAVRVSGTRRDLQVDSSSRPAQGAPPRPKKEAATLEAAGSAKKKRRAAAREGTTGRTRPRARKLPEPDICRRSPAPRLRRQPGNRAFCSMKIRRGSTSSPMSLVNISSAAMPSSIWTLSRRRDWGSMVVSQSWSGFISPKPL
jgi:DNA-directed RNA polymerase subunit RPC12/RpoP